MSCTTLVLPLVQADEALIAEVAGNAPQVLTNIDCDSSAVPGDRVRIDTTTVNKVIVAVDNSVRYPVIGVIKDKNTSTNCNVYLRGVIPVSKPQGRLYLSETGDFTITPPLTAGGYLQTLGYSFGNGKINLDPNQLVTLIS